jgi:PEGA domain
MNRQAADYMNKRLPFQVVLSCAVILCCALPMAAQQGTGYIKAKVNPGRAGVFIDGKYVGPAANFRIARKYSVAAGSHEVKLIDPRYEEYSTKVEVTARKTTVISQTLKPLPLAKPPFGRLRVQYPEKFAAVYVNGKFMGHVDEFNNFAQGLLLNPGEYTVRIEPLNGAPHEEKVTIQADKVTDVKVKI